MDFLPDDIDQYTEQHSGQEPEILAQLRRETHQKVLVPRMLSGPYQGRLLSMISKIMQPSLILEIGTYTAYSAICLAEGLAPGGRIHTIDINDELDWIREKYISAAGLENSINCVSGDALQRIPELGLSDIDLLFIDADKHNYPAYYEMCLPFMRSGGIILLDNVLWSGKVLEEAAPDDKDTKALQILNDKIQEDDRVEKVMLPIRDGLYIVRKK